MLTDMTKRSKKIHVGNVPVGGDSLVSVQSMTNTYTQDVSATVDQIKRLEEAGCEIVRVAVPDEDAAKAVREIKKQIQIPLIADIHFDHRLAILSAESGVDGLRINPGNIGKKENVRAVTDCAGTHGIPIRIGVNAGSLEKNLLKKYGGATPEAMVESALANIDMLTSEGFHQIKISLKASDVNRTVAAYRLMSRKTDFPLHVGITEAGGLIPGLVKSSIGIGMLLAEGIGDTIRVSLTRDPVEEIKAGFEILKALELREHGPDLISCPTCGRCRINLFDIAEDVESALNHIKAPVKVAVMGCVVNGPGEAREADVGIAGGDGEAILFKKGKAVKKIEQGDLVKVLMKEVEKIDKEYRLAEQKK